MGKVDGYMKKILITGAKGFIAKNLIAALQNRKDTEILQFNLDSDPETLYTYTKDCDFVFHLAGVNRAQNTDDFIQGNFCFTQTLLENLKKHANKAPILFPSSVQVEFNTPYGKSKKQAEDLLFSYKQETGTNVFVYRLPSVFGKWSKPNYNSVVSTFCYNIAHSLPILVNDPYTVVNLVYIEDVIHSFLDVLDGKENTDVHFCHVETEYYKKLGLIANLVNSFKESRNNLSIPDMSDTFTKKLYSTFLSYLPTNEFSYALSMDVDHNGSFTEFIKTHDRGHVSVNILKPGITEGNHWHHTRNEKFLVVSGNAIIRFRKVDCDVIIEYPVSGEKFEVVDIPSGYTHSITNIGETDLITIMWANEQVDKSFDDTHRLDVKGA
jgi:UDP-2-acetamido-2,6-beta-L-arabino-hexul-4-ose reductase